VSQAMSPMRVIGTLPDGRTLYYADEHFTEPGFYVPDPEGGHQRVELIPARGTPAGEAKPTPAEALYVVAVRTPIEEGGAQHRRIMDAIETALESSITLKAEGVEVGATVTLYSALTANHNGYLRELGFDFDTANRLVTVATVRGS